MLDPKKLKKPFATYRQQLADARAAGDVNEGQLRHAFANLLRALAPLVEWEFHEETSPVLDKSMRFDGYLDRNAVRRGIWEAKDPKDNLRTEIGRKAARNYPLDNALFENTRQAILYQNGREARPEPFDLDDDGQLVDLLDRFFHHTNPQFEAFDAAVVGFRERVKDLATGLRTVIGRAHKDNRPFADAFAEFADLCRDSINPGLADPDVDNLLIQHLLIQRLIERIFSADFFRHNALAGAIEPVIVALTGSGFDRDKFDADLDRFYAAIEGAARTVGAGPDAWSAKQKLLNDVYERFFQGYDPAVADTHGIVYTPQEIVDFMCASVEEVLRTEFGLGLGDPSVVVLDPCTGTGNFVVNLLRRIPREALADAYRHRLFANEIQLLPYYIAALNIEHAYYDLMGAHEPFPGLCFVDTLELAEARQKQLGFMNPENTERVRAQADAQVTVVLGNPPYNFGQKSENDNNKNRRYPVVDARVRETYSKDSTATLKNSLFDPFVKFFRWATDRLGPRDGVVCYVTNNAFLDNITFDGMRKHLLADFDAIYHLDCRGNVRQNPKLSGTAYNVFGIQVGVGITLAVRKRGQGAKRLYLHRLDLDQRRSAKLAALAGFGTAGTVPWQSLRPRRPPQLARAREGRPVRRLRAAGQQGIEGRGHGRFRDLRDLLPRRDYMPGRRGLRLSRQPAGRADEEVHRRL